MRLSRVHIPSLFRLALLLLGFLAGCDKVERTREPAAVAGASPVTKSAAVQTDQRRYALREGPFGPQTTIHTTFTAPADHTVYLLNCNGAFTVGLQRLEGTNWVHAWASEINGCFSPPIVIPAGGRLEATMTVASGVDAAVSSRRTETKIDAGTYRAVWHGLLSSFDRDARPPGGEDLPIEKRVSEPFVIEALPPSDPGASSPPQRPSEISVEPGHGTRTKGLKRVRVRVAASFPLVGTPHLYIDGEPVDQVPGTASEGTHHVVEFEPRRPWSRGRHNARVIYQNAARETHWYAWSFEVE